MNRRSRQNRESLVDGKLESFLSHWSTIPHSLLGLFLASLELLRVVEWIANLFDFGQSQGTLASLALGVLDCGFQGVLDPRLD